MPDNGRPTSTLAEASFHSVEDLNEFARLLGRQGEYRQLSKGGITSRWRWLQLGQFLLASHRTDKRVHAMVAPTRGSVTLAIMPPPFFMWVNGAKLGNDQVLVVDADSAADFASSGESECVTLTLPESELEASARALFPRTRTTGGPTRVLPVPSSGWSALQGEVTGQLRSGGMSPEDLSRLLCRFLELMAGETEGRLGEVCLGNRSTSRVAKLAQEYIEDHYSYTIRMEDLCLHSGVSLRTLQRSFHSYFQASPSEYIKARRFHAARQDLLTGASSRDRVTRVALNNGFTHLGRFSVQYREHFGESPHRTLART